MLPFDAVVMLTWSDWETEPRSNRYHYASRFQNLVPVFFLQHRYQLMDDIAVEETEFPNLKIVNVSVGLNDREISQIKDLLSEYGVKKPIFWIYDSLHYTPLLDQMPEVFRVYHATEDYLTQTNAWEQKNSVIGHSVINLIEKVDYVVACSEGVATGLKNQGHYRGRIQTVSNGCDSTFFMEISDQINFKAEDQKRKTAIFQGGINARVDFALVKEVAQTMPDWDFVFCGSEQPYFLWEELKSLPNVFWHDQAEMLDVAEKMSRATVGIIPFIQDQWIRNSFPLKAMEYIASGLPVVSVPIDALEGVSDQFAFFTTADEFKDALESKAEERFTASALQERQDLAMENSYDRRFEDMLSGLSPAVDQGINVDNKLNIAILYDSWGSMHVNCIRDHLEAFKKYSSHNITYIPATNPFWQGGAGLSAAQLNLSHFDVVIVNYSIRLSVKGHLNDGIFEALCDYDGCKIAYIQDEYEGIDVTWDYMDKIGFDIVYSCVPPDGIDHVYPQERFDKTKFLPTLTGFVSKPRELIKFQKPIQEKSVDIFYRGRQLPEIYGKLGYEKYYISEEVKKREEQFSLSLDVETDAKYRVYGDDWFKHLASARATLGTESGASIFDFDGAIQEGIDRIKAAEPEISFDDLFDRYLHQFDGIVTMNQISPKIFEAILVKTALILFEGSYSNVLEPDKHFIPLKKDFSNFAEVVEKIKSDDFIEAMTQQAYEDIILSQNYSYESFIADFDADMKRYVRRKKSPRTLYSQMVHIDRNLDVSEVLPLIPAHLSEFNLPLASPLGLTHHVEEKAQLAMQPKILSLEKDQEKLTEFENQISLLELKIEELLKEQSVVLSQKLELEGDHKKLQDLYVQLEGERENLDAEQLEAIDFEAKLEEFREREEALLASLQLSKQELERKNDTALKKISSIKKNILAISNAPPLSLIKKIIPRRVKRALKRIAKRALLKIL
ncbi:MAG: glycosyltransferase family protein [Parvibaculales bacterium]